MEGNNEISPIYVIHDTRAGHP